MFLRLKAGDLRHTHAVQGCGDIAVDFVHAHLVRAVDVDGLGPFAELQRVVAAGLGRKIQQAGVLFFQLQRMLRRALACQVVGRCHGDVFQIANAPRHQRLVAQLPPADHAVHVVANQVHGAVAHAQVELDVGKACLEVRQVRNDEQLRHRGAHVHPQAAHGVGAGVGHAGFNVIQVRQQPHGALVVGRAIGRHGHAAGGAVEQLHAQALLQRLHVLGDGGLGQRQRIGGARECAGFNDTGEYAHGLYLVHRPSWNPDNGWISAHRTKFCGR